jgi:hypothetical protein
MYGIRSRLDGFAWYLLRPARFVTVLPLRLAMPALKIMVDDRLVNPPYGVLTMAINDCRQRFVVVAAVRADMPK